jgi:hypothetical protein
MTHILRPVPSSNTALENISLGGNAAAEVAHVNVTPSDEYQTSFKYP